MAAAKIYQPVYGSTGTAGHTPHVESLDAYRTLYRQSIENPQAFRAEQARLRLSWDRNFHTVMDNSFPDGHISWFPGGQLNVAYNCVDRHLTDRGD